MKVLIPILDSGTPEASFVLRLIHLDLKSFLGGLRSLRRLDAASCIRACLVGISPAYQQIPAAASIRQLCPSRPPFPIRR